MVVSHWMISTSQKLCVHTMCGASGILKKIFSLPEQNIWSTVLGSTLVRDIAFRLFSVIFQMYLGSISGLCLETMTIACSGHAHTGKSLFSCLSRHPVSCNVCQSHSVQLYLQQIPLEVSDGIAIDTYTVPDGKLNVIR